MLVPRLAIQRELFKQIIKTNEKLTDSHAELARHIVLSREHEKPVLLSQGEWVILAMSRSASSLSTHYLSCECVTLFHLHLELLQISLFSEMAPPPNMLDISSGVISIWHTFVQCSLSTSPNSFIRNEECFLINYCRRNFFFVFGHFICRDKQQLTVK